MFERYYINKALIEWLNINKVCHRRVSTETVGAGEAGERVPGLASGGLSVRPRPTDPPVPGHHAGVQWGRSVSSLLLVHVSLRCLVKSDGLNSFVLFLHCRAASGLVWERRTREPHGEGQSQVSQVSVDTCITSKPSKPSNRFNQSIK